MPTIGVDSHACYVYIRMSIRTYVVLRQIFLLRKH